MSDDHKCVALEWQMTGEGKDYVPCDVGGSGVKLYRLEGLLLAVEVWLCRAHQKYFASCPKGWGAVTVTDVESKAVLSRGNAYGR